MTASQIHEIEALPSEEQMKLVRFACRLDAGRQFPGAELSALFERTVASTDPAEAAIFRETIPERHSWRRIRFPEARKLVSSASGDDIGCHGIRAYRPRNFATISTNARASRVSSGQLLVWRISAVRSELPTPRAAQPAWRKSAAVFRSTPPVGTIFRCGNGARRDLM